MITKIIQHYLSVSNPGWFWHFKIDSETNRMVRKIVNLQVKLYGNII